MSSNRLTHAPSTLANHPRTQAVTRAPVRAGGTDALYDRAIRRCVHRASERGPSPLRRNRHYRPQRSAFLLCEASPRAAGPTCSDVAIRYAIGLLIGLYGQPPPTPSRYDHLHYGLRHPHSGPSPVSCPELHRHGRVTLAATGVPARATALPQCAPDVPRNSPYCMKTLGRARRGPIMRALSHRIVLFLRLASAHSDVDGASERDTDSPIPRPNPRVRSGIPLTWALTVSHDCATHAPSKRKTRAAARHVRVKSLKTYMCMTSTPKSYGIRREEREAVINLPEVARRRFTSLLADVRDGDAGVRVRGEPEARHFVARPCVGDTATLEETVESRAHTAIAGVPTEMTLSSVLG